MCYGGFALCSIQLPYFDNLVTVRSIEPEQSDLLADITLELLTQIVRLALDYRSLPEIQTYPLGHVTNLLAHA